jgi:hypothetical protein
MFTLTNFMVQDLSYKDDSYSDDQENPLFFGSFFITINIAVVGCCSVQGEYVLGSSAGIAGSNPS